eukprot:3941647-Rhodomonas_salina.2
MRVNMQKLSESEKNVRDLEAKKQKEQAKWEHVSLHFTNVLPCCQRLLSFFLFFFCLDAAVGSAVATLCYAKSGYAATLCYASPVLRWAMLLPGDDEEARGVGEYAGKEQQGMQPDDPF